MHGRHRPHRSCDVTGKQRYRQQHDAQLALRNASRYRSTLAAAGQTSNWTVVRAYQCDHCNGWHLTSMFHEPNLAIAS